MSQLQLFIPPEIIANPLAPPRPIPARLRRVCPECNAKVREAGYLCDGCRGPRRVNERTIMSELPGETWEDIFA